MIFFIPPLHLKLPLGGPRRTIAFSFGTGKLESTRRWKKSDHMFTRFDRMYERDRQTDRHTDGHRMTAKAALDASIARQKSTVQDRTGSRFSLSTQWICLW